MSILDAIFGRRALSVQHGPRPLSQSPGLLWAGRESASGASVSEDGALSLSAVFAGVMLLSRVTATLPLGVFRRTKMWGREARVPATSNPSHWLLGHEFNPEMTAVMGRRVLEFQRLLWGNGYAQIAWDGAGRAAGIWPIEAWRVKPSRDDDGILYYLVDSTRRVAREDMIHVPLVSFDGVAGRSFLDYAFESLGMSISAQEFAGRFFGNDASPGTILTHPGNVPKKTRDELKSSWNEAHQGPSNARRTAVLWGGWTVSDAGMMSPEDAQLLETRRFGVEEVARWLNVPPHFLRDLSRSTFSNIEVQGTEFVVYSLSPTLKEWEQEFDRKLLSPPDVYCKHNVHALMRGDHAARSAYYSTMSSIGVMSVNEVRDLEDLNPIEGGDKHLVQLNMTTIQQAGVPAEPLPVPPPTPAPAPALPAPPAATPAPAPAPPLAASPASRALLVSTLDRLSRVEARALARAAAKPGRLFDWMDEFYAKHEANLAAALTPVVLMVGSGDPTALARTWCEASREAILAASESPPALFPARIESLLLQWAARPAAVAQEVIPCPE